MAVGGNHGFQRRVWAKGQSNNVLCPSPPTAMEADVLWQMQQVLTDLDELVSAQDELEWRNASVQRPNKGMRDGAVSTSPQPQIGELGFN